MTNSTYKRDDFHEACVRVDLDTNKAYLKNDGQEEFEIDFKKNNKAAEVELLGKPITKEEYEAPARTSPGD